MQRRPFAGCRDASTSATPIIVRCPPPAPDNAVHGSKRKDQAVGRPRQRASGGRRQEEIDPHLARPQRRLAARGAADGERRRRGWRRKGFKGGAGKHVLLPGPEGTLAGAVLGLGEARAGDPMDKPELAVGHLAERAAARLLSPRRRLRRRRSWPPSPGASAPIAFAATSPATASEAAAQLKTPRGADHARALALVEGVWLGRDLINTPASDLGPRAAGGRQPASWPGSTAPASSSIVGDDLLAKNFPMIHAVGRASDRPPRLIDLSWGRGAAAAPGSRWSARASASTPAASTSSRPAAC